MSKYLSLLHNRWSKFHFRTQLARIRQVFMILVFLASLVGVNTSPVAARPVAPAPLTDLVLRQSAVVLVNSTSPDYTPGFQHLIQPYLDHFGIPYTTLDISTAPVPATINEYALIIIGHRNLDSVGAGYLSDAEQTLISNAVNVDGAGLVNFDNALSADGVNARYAFITSIFNFSYNSTTSGSNVNFAAPATNYIIQNHNSETITTGTMSLAGITLPGSVTSLATSGTLPFLAVTTYGAGRAVQFGSYDWISNNVKGPLFGLDDTFWRSMVWAARKPFVMQGMPPFVTMRMDDTSGPLWWIHDANDYGFIPWAGVFTDDISASRPRILKSLVDSGKATTYHPCLRNAAPATSSILIITAVANYSAMRLWRTPTLPEATQWFADREIPIGKYIVPHYYEIGSNVNLFTR